MQSVYGGSERENSSERIRRFDIAGISFRKLGTRSFDSASSLGYPKIFGRRLGVIGVL